MRNPFSPDYKFKEFVSIPFENLGFLGIVLDVDGTLRPDGGSFPAKVLSRISQLRKKGFKIVLLSNCSREKAYSAMEATGLPLIRSKKPFQGSFRRAFRILGVPREKVAVVGDRRFNDILGGNLAGARTILVEKTLGDSFATRVARVLLDLPSLAFSGGK